MTKRILHIFIIALLAGMMFGSCRDKRNFDELNNDEKLELLDAKIRQHPKDAALYYERGKVLIALEQVNDAIRDFLKAVELDDDEVEYYTALGDAYFRNGKVESSYNTLNKALELDDNNLDALSKMGEILFYSKDYDRAMETLSKVTAIDPNNRTAFMMKGFMYKEQGDTANAVHYFHKVIDLYPEFAPAYEELGVLYAQHHNVLGVEYLTTTLELEPNNINALYAMGMLYQELEEADKASEYFTKILEIDPHYAEAWFNRGYMELLLYQDFDNAVEFFGKAVECNSLYIEAHYNRGVAFEQKGDKTNAAICFHSALDIDPNYQPALDGLARIGKK